MVLAAVLLAALASYSPTDPSLNTATGNPDFANWLGRPGAYLADLSWQAVGLAGLVPALLLALWGGRIYRGLPVDRPLRRLIAMLPAMLGASLALAALNPEAAAALLGARDAGGAIGAIGLGQLSGLLVDLSGMNSAPGWAVPAMAALGGLIALTAAAYASAIRWAEWRRALGGLGAATRCPGCRKTVGQRRARHGRPDRPRPGAARRARFAAGGSSAA